MLKIRVCVAHFQSPSILKIRRLQRHEKPHHGTYPRI